MSSSASSESARRHTSTMSSSVATDVHGSNVWHYAGPWPGYGEVLRTELLIAGTIAQQCPISAHTRLSLLPQRISVYAALGTAPRSLATSSKVRPVSA